MSNRYEREIEEILRNLEQPDSRTGKRPRERGRPGVRRPAYQRRFTTFNFSTSEWLLFISIVAALVAGGYAYTLGPDIFTAIVACIGTICLIVVAFSHFIFRPRNATPTRYGSVTITPLRRNPLNRIKAQWNLFLLKLRYRRKDGR